MHSLFGINIHSPRQPMYAAAKERLLRQLRHTLVLIMDERSMISADVLGAAARNCKETAHGGVNHDLSWGGIPVIILVGDDHQLPPVQTPNGPSGKGAFYVLDGTERCVNRDWGSNVETLGYSQFLELSSSVRKLTTIERQDENDHEHMSLLAALRPPDTPTDQHINKLLSLDVRHQPQKERDKIIKNAMHVYAYKEKARDWNNICIVANSSETNPIAMIKTKGTSSVSTTGRPIINHFKKDRVKLTTNIFVGARVSLYGINIIPEWGLFNGAIGTVEEIVFADGDNPNDNDQPLYVAVKFEGYTGPAWDDQNPKTVPIHMITIQCDKHCKCCTLTFCPLTPAYATTVHKFQGQGAGPTKEGQRRNEVQTMVCCPGSRGFEASNPGLVYTIISRATTLGDSDNNGSALYFIGEHISRGRFVNLHKAYDGKIYDKVRRQNKWITYLEARIETTKMTPKEEADIVEWSINKRYSKEETEDIIDKMACSFKR